MLRIKEIREAKRLSQGKVAADAKITAAYLSELERGTKENPGYNVLKRLAIALEVSISDLLSG